MRCPTCEHENPEGARFCGNCATALGPRAVAGTTPEAERRQLTVLFCDLVESTALAARLDPEDLRSVVRAFQQTCADVIHRFGGYIAQYLGDGLLVYFGYPAAHEDDAQRSVRTGLGILEGLEGLNARLERDHGVRVAARTGIHTGLVVVGGVGAGGERERLALGETPNIAARVQGLTDSNTVVISAATYPLVRQFFTFEDLGVHGAKGIAQPIRLHRVLGESSVPTHVKLTAAGGPTPLVGREDEVSLLHERWEHASEGLGQVVFISGEAGIGKSRLVAALKERVAGQSPAVLEGYCSPHAQNSAFFPIIDLLQRVLAFQRDDAPDEKLHKLETALASIDLPTQDAVPLLASLLSVPLSGKYAAPVLTSARQRQRIIETFLAWLLAMARRQPVLLIIENLHWLDPSSRELLEFIIAEALAARLLVLLTFRPDFRPPWPPRQHMTEIALDRLGGEQTAALATTVAANKRLPREVVEQVVANTDGIPLFVEELTKMVLESGLIRPVDGHFELTGPLPHLAIPMTLQDSLMARLDRLQATKSIAQLAAALGRTFRYEVLLAVSGLDEATLRGELARLVDAGLLFQTGAPPQATYVFKHALIQEAAYQSLLKITRQQYHQRIAQVLTEQFSEIAERQPEVLAHQFTRAGLDPQAISYWQLAGLQALQRSANLESIGYLSQGLELTKKLPDTPERITHELALRTLLGPALIATRGFGAAEVGESYQRALTLCRRLGETPQLFPTFWGLWVFYLVRGELRTARDLAQDMLRLGESVQDDSLLVEGHWTLGDALFWLGEFESARAHLQRAAALYDRARDHSHAFLYGQDPGVSTLLYESFALWFLGYSDQALERSERALSLARELGHPFTIAWALGCGAFIRVLRREVEATRELAEATAVYSGEQLHPFWLAAGTLMRGWALTLQGEHAVGLEQLRQGLAAWNATGSEVVQPAFLGLLAEAYGEAGQAETGLRTLEEAFGKANRNEEKASEIDLHRLRGELLLRTSAKKQDEAESCFRRAITVARTHGALSRELQAVMSLSGLLHGQGKTGEARQMLAEVCNRFTEGFDTPDFKAAKTLLAQVS